MFRVIHDRALNALYDLEVTMPNQDGSSEIVYLEPEQFCQFHLTSIYDHSVNEAFSKVLHKLIEPISYLEELLNVFCAVSTK
jgi:Ras-related GTP-binding protein C/D